MTYIKTTAMFIWLLLLAALSYLLQGLIHFTVTLLICGIFSFAVFNAFHYYIDYLGLTILWYSIYLLVKHFIYNLSN